MQEGKDLTALLIEPEGAGGSREILGYQVGEQGVHCRRPGAGGAADRVSCPDSAAGVPAVKLFLSHRGDSGTFSWSMRLARWLACSMMTADDR